MNTAKKAAAMGALAMAASVAGLLPDVGLAQGETSDDVLGMCSNYGSICEAGFECCSEDCVPFTDGKDRCNGTIPPEN